MIRKLLPTDRELYLRLANEFYQTAGVLHAVPGAYFERTFDEMMRSDVYAEGYLMLDDLTGTPVGYGQIAKTFGQEAGGIVVWLEECYIRPEHQRRGYGRAFAQHVLDTHPEAKRFRAEIEPDNAASRAMLTRLGFEPLAYQQMVREQP